MAIRKSRNRKRQLRNYQAAIKRAKQQRNQAKLEAQQARDEADKVLWYYKHYRKRAKAVSKKATNDAKATKALIDFIYNYTDDEELRQIIKQYKQRRNTRRRVVHGGRILTFDMWGEIYHIEPGAWKPSVVARLEKEWDSADSEST